MRILLKFVLDCNPDTAWHALRSPAVFRAVSSPIMQFRSLEANGFPEIWNAGPHPVSAKAFGLVSAGEQVIDLSFPKRGDGVRMEVDSGGGLSGALSVISHWHHTMAVSANSGGGTLYRDRLVFKAGILTLPLWPVMWAFWQWRGMRIRQLAEDWRP